jgi:glycosyltransferase involved in cell wall biosynthesis
MRAGRRRGRVFLMRIAWLTSTPGSPGADAHHRSIATSLAEFGHQVQTIELAGVFPLAGENAVTAARAAWLSLPPDAVPIIDGFVLSAFTPAALDARRAVGLIRHPTALPPDSSEHDRETLRAIERELLPRLAVVVATSAATRERLTSEFGVAAERIRVVAPGTPDAPRSIGGGGPCAILSVGAIVSRKGYDVLIRALARLFDLDWRLTIVGALRDPAYAATLAALSEELGVAARVRIAGDATDAALEEFWTRADLFALATQFEGHAAAVAEALKRGVPVAVTSGGAAAELVTPECGIVCPPGDVDQLSKALRRVIFDRALRADMAEAAWKIGDALPSWRTQAQALVDAIASPQGAGLP